SRPLSALCLASCLLTLAASGDDFCLPTLAFASPSSVTGLLPLDDPNTDFVEVTSCVVELRQGCLDGFAVVTETVPGAAPLTPSDGASAGASAPESDSSPHAELSPLLRC